MRTGPSWKLGLPRPDRGGLLGGGPAGRACGGTWSAGPAERDHLGVGTGLLAGILIFFFIFIYIYIYTCIRDVFQIWFYIFREMSFEEVVFDTWI